MTGGFEKGRNVNLPLNANTFTNKECKKLSDCQAVRPIYEFKKNERVKEIKCVFV
jgi:hypothetical protein